MDELDRLLVNRLQHGLPLVRHPWEALAEELGSSAETLRQRVQALLDDGTLTRFGPMFDVDRLGGAEEGRAGELGVAVTDAMRERGHLHLDPEAGELTASGRAFLRDLGIDLRAPARSRRLLCRPCLDWSERRPHLAGRAGAAVADLALQRDWIRRRPQGRSVEITAPGLVAFRDVFGARI